MVKKVELHKIQNGVCSICNKKNDVKVMTFSDSNKDTLICLPCSEKVTFKEPRIDFDYLETISKKIGIDSDSVRKELFDFSSKYVLVQYNKQNGSRLFWSWVSSDSPFNFVSITKKGWIHRIVLKDGTELFSPLRTIKNTSFEKSFKIHVDTRLKYLLAEKEAWYIVQSYDINNLNLMPAFLTTKPSPKKIDFHKKFYIENKKFEKPIAVIQTRDSYTLIDCYTVYLAAKELNVTNIDLIVVG